MTKLTEQSKRYPRDVLIEIHNYNWQENETGDHVVTYQIHRKHLRKIKKLLKESFKEDNLF